MNAIVDYEVEYNNRARVPENPALIAGWARDAAAWREPVGDAGLLGGQVEPQFPDFPAQVAGIGLAEILGLLGEQADVEVDPAEVTVAQPGQPGTDFRLDLDPVQPAMHPMLYASDAMGKPEPASPRC